MALLHVCYALLRSSLVYGSRRFSDAAVGDCQAYQASEGPAIPSPFTPTLCHWRGMLNFSLLLSMQSIVALVTYFKRMISTYSFNLNRSLFLPRVSSVHFRLHKVNREGVIWLGCQVADLCNEHDIPETTWCPRLSLRY